LCVIVIRLSSFCQICSFFGSVLRFTFTLHHFDYFFFCRMLNNLTIFFITSIAYCCLCIHRFPIIEPDPGHTKLRLSSEGLEAIKRITNPIAAVSVCPAFFLSPKLLCFSIILQSVTVMQWFLLFRMNFLCFKYSKCSLSMAAIVQSLLLIVHLQVDIFLICIAISRKISLFFFFIYIYIPFLQFLLWLYNQVIGPYRSGKSFLLNQLLSLSCYEGTVLTLISLFFSVFF